MGALQVEVKVLKKAPLLFVWENKESHKVEGYLITCPCQQLGLQGATGDAKKGSSIFQGGDEKWAKRLAHALEISEVVSFSSLEPCGSIGYDMKHTEDSDIADDHYRKKKKKKKAKKSSKKKENFEDLGSGLSNTDVSPHDVEGMDIDSDEVVQEQSMATIEAEEHDDDESQSSMQEDMFSSRELIEGKTDLKGSHVTNENPEADAVGHSDSHGEITINSEPASADVSNASKECPSPARSDARDDEHSSVHDVQVHTEDLSMRKNERRVNGSEDQSQIIPVQLSSTHGTVTVISKNNTIAHVTLASRVPAIEEESFIEAINNIMEIHPGTVIDVQETVQEVREVENPTTQMIRKSNKPDFIRTLTEEERKNMFKFHSDVLEENLKRLQEGGKCFLCEHCGKVITTGRQKQHMETHSIQPRTRDVTCDQCGKSFFDKIGLSHHMKTHATDPRFSCRYCSKKYKSLFGRTLHERAHFNIYAGICNQCGRKFLSNNKYKEHISLGCTGTHRPRRHRREFRGKTPARKGDPGTTTCHICGKVLRTASMSAHMDFHEGKMFQCPVCNKSVQFTTRYAHIKIHSEERNHVCSVCNKCFKTKGVLRTHMMTHTGERPLKCRYCGKGFSRYTSRSVHETIHTGERPFPCTICNKGWKDRATYMAHMKRHHPGEPVFYKRKSSIVNQLISLQSLKEKQNNAEPNEDS